MITKKRKTGNKGEDLACEYLRLKGYEILKRNYIMPIGEIDIIVQKGNTISFIEVKTAYKESNINPEENITSHKLRKLTQTAEFYIANNKNVQKMLWRIDAVFVLFDKISDYQKITHIENINII